MAHDALLDDGGARDAVAAALAAVTGRAPFREAADRLASLLAELDDLGSEVRDVAEGIEDDPERLAAVRERRQQLRDLRRKYGDDLAEVIAYGARAAARLDELGRFEERAAALDAERREAVATERHAAEAVGRARRRAAPELAAGVTARLRELALPHATVSVEVGEHDDDHPGDRVQFLFAANPGTPLQPLTKVASGGELARAMLALRLVLSDERDEPARTLVFDEVDAGIGGTAATAVGRALAEVGRAHQVLVVTHLAQVARAGDDAGRRHQVGGGERHHGDGRGRRRRRSDRRAGPDAVRRGGRRGGPPARRRAPPRLIAACSPEDPSRSAGAGASETVRQVRARRMGTMKATTPRTTPVLAAPMPG